MKKLFQAKRIFAMTLAAAMVITMTPATSYAASAGAETIKTETTETADDTVTPETAEGETQETLPEEKETPAPLATELAVVENGWGSLKTEEVYTGSGMFDFTEIKRFLSVKVDGNEDLSCRNDLTAVWKAKKGDGAYEAMAEGALPVNAGSYKLTVSLAAKEGRNSAASLEIDFTVKKAPVTILLAIGSDRITVGTTVKAVKDEVAANYTILDDTGVITKADVKSIQVTVKDAFTDVPLAEDAVLAKTGDYAAEAEVQLTEEKAANYEIAQIRTLDLKMSDLKESFIGISVKRELGKTYDGQPIADLVKGIDYDARVEESGSGVEIPDAEIITDGWYVYDNLNGERKKLDKAPTEVGSYGFGISYAGKEGIYTAFEQEIFVDIVPMEIMVVPNISEGAEFYPGMRAQDVLAEVEYKVMNTAAEPAEVAIDKDIFWGTHINKERSIPIAPQFVVQEKEKGAEDSAYEEIRYYDKIREDKEYRIIFNGKGIVYSTSGMQIAIGPDLFAQDENYKLKTDADTRIANAIVLPMKAGLAADIDVSAMTTSGGATVGDSLENPITKEYDGNPLFALRADYKKAVVKETATQKELAKNTDAAISYKWWRYDGVREDLTPIWGDVSYYNSPSEAGKYKLTISYTDESGKYYAAKEDVFYEITPQQIRVVPGGEFKVLTETWIDGFQAYLCSESAVPFTIQAVSNGTDVTKAVMAEEDVFFLDWKVVKVKDAATGETEDVPYGQFAKENEYKVAVQNFSCSSNYENVTAENGMAPITLEEMGSEELTIEVDLAKLQETVWTKEYDGQPFDVSAAMEGGLVTVKNTKGEAVTDAPLIYTWHHEDGSVYTEAVNAGTYTLKARFDGSTSYKAAMETVIAEGITITKREVTVTASAAGMVTAGTDAYDVPVNVDITGYAQADETAFTELHLTYDSMGGYWYTKFDAFAGPLHINIYNEDGSVGIYGKLKSGETYMVMAGAALAHPYSENYELKLTGNTFTTERGMSIVYGSGDLIPSYTPLKDSADAMNHIITPQSAIRYTNLDETDNSYSKMIDALGTSSGNFVEMIIEAPSEFGANILSTAMYENSIRAAGGYCQPVYMENKLYVVFDAGAKDKKEFKIRWKDGYVETFTLDFSAAQLMEDLNAAVAPKSLAFNAPLKTMVIGEEQQLDVKLTKVLEDDIVSLAYKTDNDKILKVDEKGNVTALSAGKATVTVYPVMGDDKAPIAGAKTASVQITVKDVTAPKIKKVTPKDGSAQVEFAEVEDGYRREIYVLEGKGIKAEVFEQKIASVKNEQWLDVFPIPPVWFAKTSSAARKVAVNNLKPSTDYTVYVRNISKKRTLPDGSIIEKSAAGSTGSFSTTKTQVSDLYADIANTEADENDIYRVKLSSGKVKINVTGRFHDASDGAETLDYLLFTLPLNKEQQKTYLNPKLNYTVYDAWIDEHGIIGREYEKVSAKASVDKKGNMVLKGVGLVAVVIYDSISMRSTAMYVDITAAADSVANKTTKLQVGQTAPISSLLTYKEGKKTLTGNYSTNIEITEAVDKAFAGSEHFELHEYGGELYVKAVKAGGKLTVDLTDLGVKATGSAKSSAKATITSAALAPVTKLTITNITDINYRIEFQPSAYAESYKIEITNGKNQLIESMIIDSYSFINNEYDSGLQHYRDGDGNIISTYYTQDIWAFKNSKYNVSVTALCGDTASKTVKKAVKTTKMPASYEDLDRIDKNGWKRPTYSGAASYTTTINSATTDFISLSWEGNSLFTDYRNHQTLYSGNSYTFVAGGNSMNYPAKYSKTDSLIWSSSNKKVASINANAGTYSATFKALKAGTTTIEVKSKMTKKVIARYEITVTAVGDANGITNEYYWR